MMQPLKYCPSSFSEGYESYSPEALIALFDGAKVSHILPFSSPKNDDETFELFLDHRKRISVSGIQEKISLRLHENELRLLSNGEQGTHILKPIPRDLKKVNEVPINEHLTMQIAQQIYNIPTAANALIFFQDGTPAYITRRFDLQNDETKIAIEDFASLAGKHENNSGPNYKYEYSYEALAALVRKYSSTTDLDLEKYFKIIIFNYLFSNGDAHLKNFSLIENKQNGYELSPTYDLLNTKIHVADTDFALRKGLFEDDFRSATYRKQGHPSKTDFLEFAHRIGLAADNAELLLVPFLQKQAVVETFVQRSLLSESSKNAYLIHYNTKRNYLNQI